MPNERDSNDWRRKFLYTFVVVFPLIAPSPYCPIHAPRFSLVQDVINDIHGAQLLGMKGILVRTGMNIDYINNGTSNGVISVLLVV